MVTLLSGDCSKNLCNCITMCILIFMILSNFCQNTYCKTYSTEDSVILEGDPPQLPGPSIFEYKNEPLPLPSSDSNPKVVKRGNAKAKSEKEKSPDNPRYYEIAGDELYVFEPSPLGAEPFMEALFSQREPNQSPAKHRNLHPNKENKSSMRHRPPPYQKFHPGRGRRPPQPYGHPKHRPLTPNGIGEPDKQEEISSSSSNSNSNSNKFDVEGKCITVNEKEGLCIQFKMCYPVVFNMVDGQLQNFGLARMLYQASGSCDRNDTWTVQTVSVQVQPGVLSNVPLEMSPDFYNQKVCCPGLFYNANKIQDDSPNYSHHNYHYEYARDRSPIKMKPSHSDPMLSPKGRGFLLHPLPLPPMFQETIESGLLAESEPSDYYVDEFDDYSSYTSTTEAPKPKQKTKSRVPSQSTTSTHSNSTKSANRSKPKPAIEVNSANKSSKPVSPNSKNKEIESSPSQEKFESSSSNVKSRVNTNTVEKSSGKHPNHKSQHENTNIKKGPVPVVVAPPHLSAWNCPGRQIGMPRGHWPWMVALLNEGSHFCSGSLIDHRHVLTSATCVASFQGKDIGRMRAILGDRVLYSSVDGPHMWRKILRITRHLQYNSESMEHDIAILEMDNPVTYSPNIQPINLPSSDHNEHTDKAIVSGWSGADIGKRFFSARPTIDVVVEFMDRNECYRKYDGFKLGKIPDGIICTKPSNTSCRADLGAPLMMKTGNCWHVIGILSHGLGCGMFPEIFTETAKHIPWIQKNIRQLFPIQETFLKP